MMKVVMMNRKQKQRLCKVMYIVFVADTLLKKDILFSCLDLLVFPAY